MTAHLEPQIVIPAGDTYPAAPSALALKDDRLLLVYATGEASRRRSDNPPKIVRLPGSNTLAAIVHSWYQGAKSKDRRQLASVISEDGGRTWGNFRLIGYAADGKDGFLQHSVTFAGDVAYLFYGGGSRRRTCRRIVWPPSRTRSATPLPSWKSTRGTRRTVRSCCIMTPGWNGPRRDAASSRTAPCRN